LLDTPCNVPLKVAISSNIPGFTKVYSGTEFERQTDSRKHVGDGYGRNYTSSRSANQNRQGVSAVHDGLMLLFITS